MGNVTVIGAQWGDEGKGKIVDWLASRADMVVRFQGGHNAGHTLVIKGHKTVLRLMPSLEVSSAESRRMRVERVKNAACRGDLPRWRGTPLPPASYR